MRVRIVFLFGRAFLDDSIWQSKLPWFAIKRNDTTMLTRNGKHKPVTRTLVFGSRSRETRRMTPQDEEERGPEVCDYGKHRPCQKEDKVGQADT